MFPLVVALVFAGPLRGEPTLLSPPLTEIIELNGTAQFTFSEPLALDGIDVTWSGSGIDPGKITCDWFTVQGIVISNVLNCTYAGGWPAGVEVEFTLNAGDSGVFRSLANGDPLAETSGTFMTPGNGTGGPSVTVTPASGGTYDPTSGEPVTFTFSQPMKATTSLEWDAGSWSCDWDPSNPDTVFACVPDGDPAPGIYRWTLNGSTPGFESQDGERLSSSFGTLMVEGDPSDPGFFGGDAPTCPDDHVALGLPKRLHVCGGELSPWTYALALPDFGGDGYAINGFSTAPGDGRTVGSLVKLDAAGLAQWQAFATAPDAVLNVGSSDHLVRVSTGGRQNVPLSFGVFDINLDLAPVYQHRLPEAARRAEVSSTPSRQTIVYNDPGDGVETMAIGPGGEVDWAFRYEGEIFAGPPRVGTPTADARSTGLFPLQDGFLVLSLRTERGTIGQPGDIEHTIGMLRLSTDGAVVWAKTYSGVGGATTPFVFPAGTDGFFIATNALDFSDPENPDTTTQVFKFDGAGLMQWGLELDDVAVLPESRTVAGKTLLHGTLADPNSGDLTQSLILVNATGTLERQILLETDRTGFLAVSGVGDRIYYHFAETSPTTGETVKFTVGTSDLDLRNFAWKAYESPVVFAFANYDEARSELLVSMFSGGERKLDLMRLNAALEMEGDCGLFVDENPFSEIVVSTLAARNVALTAEPISVTASSFAPSFETADLELRTFHTADGDLCERGVSVGPVDFTLSIRKTADAMAELAFPTRTGRTYTIQKASDSGLETWSALEMLPGTGAEITRRYPLDPRQAHFRVGHAAP